MGRKKRGEIPAGYRIVGEPSTRQRAPGDPDRPPKFSDEALALGFAAGQAVDLRYVHLWGQWLWWNGSRWLPDQTLKAVDLARHHCRAAAAEAPNGGVAKSVASRKVIESVISLARADRRIAATADQWDADPFLLTTPAGIIDLRTGRAREARRADYVTKVTAVAPNESCPTWLAFLDRITAGNRELQAFLCRVAGYALTGSTREHALFFLYGTGANGKSVFLSTLSGILGDYADIAPIEAFVASHNDRHPTELAKLRGARLVTAVETEEGRRWAEAKIKALTGGDRIAARFMRQDFFEFVPQFKLLIAGNHKPGLRSVDEAIRRRLHLVPFTVTIPPAERDETLAERLRAEWPGILQWALDGCSDWLEHGLSPPAIVRDTTAAYIASEDAIGQWLGEECLLGPDEFALTAALFTSWRRWAERSGEYVGSAKRLAQALQDRGFEPKREGGTGRAGFRGIAVKREELGDAAGGL